MPKTVAVEETHRDQCPPHRAEENIVCMTKRCCTLTPEHRIESANIFSTLMTLTTSPTAQLLSLSLSPLGTHARNAPCAFLPPHRLSTECRRLRRPRSRLGTTASNNDEFVGPAAPGVRPLHPLPRASSPSSGRAPRQQQCCWRLQCRGFVGSRVRGGTPEVGGLAERDGRSKKGAAQG